MHKAYPTRSNHQANIEQTSSDIEQALSKHRAGSSS